MFRKSTGIVAIILFAGYSLSAQQFIGLTTHDYISVNQLALNPAWVNNARLGTEVNLVGINVFAGNTAYQVNGGSLFSLGGKNVTFEEGKDYSKIDKKGKKKLWANTDVMGPSVAFKYKNGQQLGIYTRFRAIAAGGNITKPQLDIYSNDKAPAFFNHTIELKKAGAVAQTFGEIGFTYGKMIRNDLYYKAGYGVSIKYLMGFAAMNIYTDDLTYQRHDDSIVYAKGDLTALYTFNTNPDGTADLGKRTGRGGLGLDLGFFYEYYDNADPNKKSPYKYSVAASITDIGAVPYFGDAGSGSYNVVKAKTKLNTLQVQDIDNKEYGNVIKRLTADTILSQTNDGKKFRIGLPTAFRLTADYNLGAHVYVAVNTMVNLRGFNGEVYNPGYDSYLNLTPRYDLGAFKVGLPFTMMRYKTMQMGFILYLGPLYIGSASLLSAATGQNIRNIDIYTGIASKFVKNKREHLYEFDNAYDDPDKGLRSLRKILPRFLRKDASYRQTKCQR